MISAKKSEPKRAGKGVREGEILIFSANSSNVQEWKKLQELKHMVVFGGLAEIIRTSEAYVQPHIMKPSEIELGFQPGEMSQADLDEEIKIYMTEARKYRFRKIFDQADNERRLCASLRQTMSKESVAIVDADIKFDPNTYDPVKLMQAIDRTHLTNQSGQATAGAHVMDSVKLMDNEYKSLLF